MIQRLNYYSRYNRIRVPRQIGTLYHLVGNLNLDVIISDDVIEKFSTLKQQNLIMRAQRRNQDQSGWISPSLQIEQKESEGKRHVSWEKNTQRSSEEEMTRNRQKVKNNKKLKILTSREKSKDGEIQLFQSDKLNRNYIQIEEDAHEPKQISIQQNRSKTNNLSEIQCLQTQSIPQTVKEDELNLQTSFIMNKETFNENNLQQQYEQKQRVFQIPKNCQSQFFQTNRKENQENPKSSNFQDEFSEGLAELNKVDEIRKSTAQQNLPYDYSYNLDLQDYRSEKLQRVYGSDFQIQLNDDIDHFAPYDQDHPDDNNEEYFQDNIQIPIIINGKDNIYQHQNSFQDNGNFHFNNEQINNYVHHEQQQEYEQDQQEGNSVNQHNNEEYVSIDNRLPQEQANRIPTNGLTEGNWPLTNTQNSIDDLDQYQQFYVPPIAYVNRSQTNNSNINSQKQRKPFKRIMMGKKLNPRMVTSTFVNDPPVKKVNFKKVMKKETIENATQQQIGNPQQNKKIRQVKPTEERKLLLKAFFDQN